MMRTIDGLAASSGLWCEHQLGQEQGNYLTPAEFSGAAEALPVTASAHAAPRTTKMIRFAVELLVGQDVVFEWVGRASSECAGLAQAQHAQRIMWR